MNFSNWRVTLSSYGFTAGGGVVLFEAKPDTSIEPTRNQWSFVEGEISIVVSARDYDEAVRGARAYLDQQAITRV